MEKKAIVEAFGAIAQATRLEALRLLLDHLSEGIAAGEIARLLDVPQNTMSAHLAVLKRAGLVRTQRSGTTVVYQADTECVWKLVDYLVTDFGAQALPQSGSRPRTIPRSGVLEDRVYNVLFICTANSARSIMGEAILNREGEGRFRAFSAGSHPRGEIHPLAMASLEALGYETTGLRSKSWSEFARPDAPVMDFVFTVCDRAAGEQCPVWRGHPITAHWGIEDPEIVTGSAFQREAAFEDAARFLKNRIVAFVSLPVESIDSMSLRQKLTEIGLLRAAP